MRSFRQRLTAQFFNAAGSELLNEVINNSEVTADPDAVDDMFNQLKNTYSSYASSYGLEFDQFLSMFLERTRTDSATQQRTL